MKSFKRLHEQAYDYLKDMILTGQFNGDEMYSEAKTAADLGISRTPVRDALLRLTQEGYIDIYPSKGYKIRATNPNDIRDICQIRSAIEGFCVYKLAQDIERKEEQDVLQFLRKCLEEQRKLLRAKEPNLDLFTESETKFHNAIIEYLNNQQFRLIFKQYEYKMKELKFNFLQHHDRLSAALKEHSYIVSLVENGEAENVYEFMLTHILPSTYFSLRDLGESVD